MRSSDDMNGARLGCAFRVRLGQELMKYSATFGVGVGGGGFGGLIDVPSDGYDIASY